MQLYLCESASACSFIRLGRIPDWIHIHIAVRNKTPPAVCSFSYRSLLIYRRRGWFKQVTASPAQSFPRHTVQGLDRRRLCPLTGLHREANLEGDLSIERMAAIARRSRFHFARSFRQAVGQSPHRYVSAKRLERAKALLMHGDRPLVDIALALSFSSQANFTKAFTQATGQAPGQFRQRFGSRQPEPARTDVRRSSSCFSLNLQIATALVSRLVASYGCPQQQQMTEPRAPPARRSPENLACSVKPS